MWSTYVDTGHCLETVPQVFLKILLLEVTQTYTQGLQEEKV